MGREETVRLAQGAARAWIKAGAELLHVPRRLREDEVLAYLVHEDGWMRVPVLLAGDLLVRGYTDVLYRQALGEPPGA